MDISLTPINSILVIQKYEQILREMYKDCYKEACQEDDDLYAWFDMKNGSSLFPTYFMLQLEPYKTIIGFVKLLIIKSNSRACYKKCLIDTIYIRDDYIFDVEDMFDTSKNECIIKDVYANIEAYAKHNSADILIINIPQIPDNPFMSLVMDEMLKCGMTVMTQQYVFSWERSNPSYGVPKGWRCVRSLAECHPLEEKHLKLFTDTAYNSDIFGWVDDSSLVEYEDGTIGGIFFQRNSMDVVRAACSVIVDTEEDMTHLVFPRADSFHLFEKLIDIIQNSTNFPETKKATMWLGASSPYCRYLVKKKAAILNKLQLVAQVY